MTFLHIYWLGFDFMLVKKFYFVDSFGRMEVGCFCDRALQKAYICDIRTLRVPWAWANNSVLTVLLLPLLHATPSGECVHETCIWTRSNTKIPSMSIETSEFWAAGVTALQWNTNIPMYTYKIKDADPI